MLVLVMSKHTLILLIANRMKKVVVGFLFVINNKKTEGKLSLFYFENSCLNWSMVYLVKVTSNFLNKKLVWIVSSHKIPRRFAPIKWRKVRKWWEGNTIISYFEAKNNYNRAIFIKSKVDFVLFLLTIALQSSCIEKVLRLDYCNRDTLTGNLQSSCIEKVLRLLVRCLFFLIFLAVFMHRKGSSLQIVSQLQSSQLLKLKLYKIF